MANGWDDFDQIDACPAPECEKTMMKTIYNVVLKFAQLAQAQGKEVIGPYLDLLYYFTCKKHLSGQFMAEVFMPTPEPGVFFNLLCTYSYCCLLSPASWVYSEMKLFSKFRDCTIEVKWDTDKIQPDLCMQISASVEPEMLASFRMYKLEPPFYKLLSE